MKIEIWSDVVCPWCYVGKRRFEKALARFAGAGEVEDAETVRTQEQDARRLGITGVPFFVFDRKYGVSGAQPPEVFLEVLEKAAAG